MNAIEWFVLANPDMRVMDILHGNGLISDLCVLPSDIHPADVDRALAFLQTIIPTKP